MPKQTISTAKAPAAVGPYSQAAKIGPLVFASGQLPLDPETGLKVTGGVAKETERAMENLKAENAELKARLEKLEQLFFEKK